MIGGKAKVWITAGAMLLSVFMAGILAGAAVIELDGPPRFGQGGELRDGRGPGRDGPGRDGGRGGRGGPGGAGMIRVLPPGFMEELGLTAEQQAQVDEVLARRRADSEAVLQEMLPRLRALVDSTNVEIRELLTPDQQAQFDAMRESLRDRGQRGPREP